MRFLQQRQAPNITMKVSVRLTVARRYVYEFGASRRSSDVVASTMPMSLCVHMHYVPI